MPFAALVARLQGEWAAWRRWWLALWLVLVTHPLLDGMTVYGTQLALPFSHGFYALDVQGERLRITDLRMGQEPTYTFRFEVAQQRAGTWVALPTAVQPGMPPDIGRAWAWLWRRALGQPLPPPR